MRGLFFISPFIPKVRKPQLISLTYYLITTAFYPTNTISLTLIKYSILLNIAINLYCASIYTTLNKNKKLKVPQLWGECINLDKEKSPKNLNYTINLNSKQFTAV